MGGGDHAAGGAQARERETGIVDGGEAVGAGQVGAVIGHGEIVEGDARFRRFHRGDGGGALCQVLQHIEARLVAGVDQWAEGGDDLQQLIGVDAQPFLPAMQPDLGLSDVQRLAMDLRGVGYNPDALQDVFNRRRREWAGGLPWSARGCRELPSSRSTLRRIVQVWADECPEISYAAARKPA